MLARYFALKQMTKIRRVQNGDFTRTSMGLVGEKKRNMPAKSVVWFLDVLVCSCHFHGVWSSRASVWGKISPSKLRIGAGTPNPISEDLPTNPSSMNQSGPRAGGCVFFLLDTNCQRYAAEHADLQSAVLG